MRERIIDRDKLWCLFATGRSIKFCAEKFNVSTQVIGRYKKEYDGAATQSLVLKHADDAVKNSLDAQAQLLEINTKARSLITLAEKAMDGDKKALLKLGVNSPVDVMAKFLREQREQLRLYGDLAKMFIEVKEIKGFQDAVIDVLREIGGDDAISKLLDRLNANRLVS